MTSASVPAPDASDHISGDGPEVILYIDFACPHCAALWQRARALPLRLCFRHFPMKAKRPRSPALHAAAEAAGGQGAFWEMADSLFADRGRVDDPHLWERAERFGLDLDRFLADSRSEEVAARIRRDFEGGIRAGVSGTPAGFVAGRAVTGSLDDALAALAG